MHARGDREHRHPARSEEESNEKRRADAAEEKYGLVGEEASRRGQVVAGAEEEHGNGCDHGGGAEEVDGPFFGIPAQEFFRVEEAEVEP